MEKSFDEITVSSLSDLQLGSSSEYQSQNQTPGDQVQQVQRNSNSSSAGNGNENNLNRQKRSSKQQHQQQQSVFNPSRHLDVWLANAIRGLENANSGGGQDSDLLDSPTLLKGGGGFGEPLSLPPNLGYLDVPNSSSSPTTGIFSPTQQQQLQQLQQQHQLQQQLQQSQQFLLNPTSSSPYLQRGGGGYATSFPSSEGIEFASLPPRISHNQQYQQYQQQQQLLQQGRRAGSQNQNHLNQSASSFQDLLNAQRSMTDPYINDSSDNESKNGSCTTKSKLESAEALLADLNLLNSASANNGSGNATNTNTNNIANGNNGLNGTSTTTTGNNSATNTNNSNNGSSSNNNLVLVLLKEISKLHETNKKICRNLHETKVEMEALKHAPHWGLSHRRDSISGLSTNSQPIGVGHHHLRYSNSIGGGGGGGLHSPAPTYHSQGNYTPGIVSDVVREIREVSRVREEALMDRMKTLIEERSWAVNETNFRLLKETEDMKKSIHSVRSEMHQFMDRMLKLENEVITLKGQLSHVQQQQQQQQQQVQHQNSFVLRERDSYGQGLGISSAAAAAKFRRNSMHLNYGRINSTDEFYGNNFNDVSNELRFSNGSNSGGTSTGNSRINTGSGGNKFGENNFATSCSSSLVNGGGFGGKTGMAREDPRGDNLVVMHVVEDVEDQDELGDVNSSSDQVLALEKDALKLRRELQDALASKQESESRITALESIVSTLKEQVPPAALTAAASTAAQQHPHHHSQLLLTTTSSSTSNTNLNPAGTSNYFRTINSGSPQQQQQQVPGTVSPKLQKAAQVQSLASPSSKQQQQQQQHQHQQFQQRFLDHSTMPSGVMNVTGPVTDL